jgi:hypothetical protein
MTTTEPILVSIQADVQQLKNGLAQAQSSLKGLGDSVKQSGKSMDDFVGKLKQVGATLGVTFGAAAVLNFLKASVVDANAAAAAQDRLRQLLITTGGATNDYVDTLIAQADALEKIGVVSASNIIVAQSQLATFDLTGDTIKTLTPAILDYVTAEKGAAATADDFRQMTNGLAQALNGNFGSLTRVGFVLDDATKKLISSGTESERAAAIVKVLSSTYEGFNENLRDTNPIAAASADLQKLQGDIGAALLPVLKKVSGFISDTFIPAIRSFGKFIKDNADIIGILTVALGLAYVSMKVYRGMVVITAIAQQVFAVATTLMRGAQLASIASTNGLAASMLALNAAMRANPIGIIVTALALVAAALVIAWKRSETFRNVVINVAQVALKAFASIIPIIGKVAEAVLKVMTGPLRGFLTLLSKLPGVGKYAKSALDFINNGLDGISDFADGAAKKATELSAGLDKLRKSATKAGEEVKKATKGGGGGGGGGKATGLSDEQKEKLADYNKRVKDIYSDMNEVFADANENLLEAQKDRDESINKANVRYSETVADLNKRYSEALADSQLRYDDAVSDAQKTYAKSLADNAKDYANKLADIEEKLQEKMLDLRQKALEKTADLNRAATEKQASIVQQSMDRLRSAFASALNLDNLVKGASPKNMIKQLENTLFGARRLQENAAALAGMGYSQTFIEQVVKNGPRVGNKIAESLKNASPEASKKLQSLYLEVEKISESGMDDLAQTMNAGGKLATQELMKEYKKVAVDLKNSLSEVDRELNFSLSEAHKDYRKAIADAQSASMQRLAEAKARMDESLADALVTLTRSRAEAKKQLDEGLAEAQKTLAEALIETQKNYDEAVDKINKDTQKKILELKKKLEELAKLIAEISKSEAALALKNAPGGSGGGGGGGFFETTSFKLSGPAIPYGSPGSVKPGDKGFIGPVAVNNTVNVTGYNMTSPAATGAAVSNQLKYGSTVNTTTLAGILAASKLPSRTTPSTSGGGGGGRTAAKVK